MLGNMNKGLVVCKMSTIVNSKRAGGQNWVKFGPHSY